MTTPATDGTALIAHDPWLEPYAPALRHRFAHYLAARERIDANGGLTGAISTGYQYFGLNRGRRDDVPGIWYREWAPAAHYLSLFGDFNDWNRDTHPMQRDEWGVWHLFIPDDSPAGGRLTHGSRVKVHIRADNGWLDRLPAYIRRVVQTPGAVDFTGQFWDAPEFDWHHPVPARRGALRIYEAHVGMAQEHGRVGSYNEFTEHTLPHIAGLGYNAIQLMAVMEHPYYASFGYHVSSFFAPTSRFGTPEELKRLVDEAHGRGLLVIMDLVHSHAVRNVNEGLNGFDGTDHQYFHAGPRGLHVAWDSLCFDYSRYEVLRFLLSNARYWLDEFHFDGYRFDGVTSMLYRDHGLARLFTSYDQYFDGNVDLDALTYLMLANEMIHEVRRDAVTIAEDVSGMVGVGRPVREGGIGFDYRLAMGLPDFWFKMVEDRTDESWRCDEVFHEMLNRRPREKHVAYAESHDQAMVGGKTLAFQMMDAAMHHCMSVFTQNHIVDRGVALHKIIRLVTFSLGGEAWLTFMGNEFGHPDWIDFPREGNNFSYHYARRQWSLAHRDDLRYQGLMRFEAAMLKIDADFHLLDDPFIEKLMVHEDMKLLVYRRGPLVFVVNFHPHNSYSDLRIPVPDPRDYQCILDSDASIYSGHGRTQPGTHYPKQDVSMEGRDQSVQIYLPNRSAQVLRPV